MGVGGQRHSPAALPQGKRPGPYRRRCWVGLTTGLNGCGKFRPNRDSIPADRPARSKSLYRLSYPGPEAKN